MGYVSGRFDFTAVAPFAAELVRQLIGEADGRRHYEIYGWQPGYEEIEGTDLYAVAQGRISVTPIHFDLTDHGGLQTLRSWDFEEMLAACGARTA